MPATGIFATSITKIKDTITALGLTAVTDPRNARPLTCLIEMPTYTQFTNQVADISVVVHILAGPPSNQDSGDYLMTTLDILMDSELAITGGSPTLVVIGAQELPAYDVTIRIGAQR